MDFATLKTLPNQEVIYNLKNLEDLDDFDIPTKLPLMGYQRVDALYHFMVKKSFNLDDPGLGKTAISLGYLTLLQSTTETPLKALIVCPSAVMHQWGVEIERFTDFSYSIVDKAKGKRLSLYDSYNDSDTNLLVLNYEKLRADIDFIKPLNFDTVVFDEATALKDATAQVHKAATVLCSSMDRVLMLTATPIGTNLEEFYNMFSAAGIKGVLPNYQQFCDTFLIMREMKIRTRWGTDKIIRKASGSKNVELFRSMIDPYFIRRENDKAAFKDLKLNMIKKPVLITSEQAKLLRELRDQEVAKKDMQPLVLYGEFSKVVCAPYIYDTELSRVSPKIEELIKILNENPNQKYVVFGRFLLFHDLIQERLNDEGIKYVSITGLESAQQKEDAKNTFTNDPNVRVAMLTSAGKFGLNMQVTNKIIFLDVPYTPSDTFQYIGRVFRTGQTKDVDALFIYAKSTLEELQFQRLYERQSAIDAFFAQNKASMFDLPHINMAKSFMAYAEVPPPYYDVPEGIISF